MAREINLVPDIKNEMIKALKLRNLIFFICIVVAIVSVVIIGILGSIVGGQQIAVNNKKDTIGKMSEKIKSYSDLNDFLTIRDQLGNLSDLADNKKVLSRTFNILSALMPTGSDTITISELNVNLADTTPTFSFDAQANAGKEPFIDYNVLDSFKKSMQYMRYDFGTYVDKDGNEIPAYCMIETADDGSFLNEGEKGVYALWKIDGDGCNPGGASYITQEEKERDEAAEEEEKKDSNKDSDDNKNSNSNSSSSSSLQDLLNNNSSNKNNNSNNSSNKNNNDDEDEGSDEDSDENSDNNKNKKVENPDYVATEAIGDTDGDQRENYAVKIWRTPQYDEWYKDQHMDENGDINGIPHFKSQCITYKGEKSGNSDKLKWSESNDSCLLVPDGADGIRISDSSNGLDSNDELVLRFSAVISFNPEVYKFANHHMMAIAPAGHLNVTDSYVQIQAMFGERAHDCEPGDTTCSSNTQNVSGGEE